MNVAESPVEDLDVDLLVIGAGPSGLYAAYYAGFRGLRVAVIDALPQLGGQISAMYPEKAIYDIAGYASVKGRDLVTALVEQADQFKPTYLLDEQAQGLLRSVGGALGVTTHRGRTVRAGAIVVTGGIGTFSPRPMVSALRYLDRGLSYFVPDLASHAGKDVVIVGGGDSAFDWALHLEPIANSVTLVHRRDRFRAHRASIERVQSSSVRMIVNADVTSASGDDWLSHVTVTEKGEDPYDIEAQSLVAALGFTADLSALEGWGLDIRSRTIPVGTRMETNIPGIYAAGDITDYPGKVRLISVGFGEAATAVNNAAHVLDPEAEIFPGHSTEQES